MADENDEKQPIYEDDEPEGGLFRWMSALVVMLAVAGFFGLAWYAYRNGGDTVDEKDVELIKAEKTPVKEAPANPGGMQIPNQDKTVYGLISGKTEKPVVERILPAPEEPLPRTGDTQTWMSDTLKNKNAAGDESAKPTAPAASDDTDTNTPAPKEQFNPAKLRAVTPSVPVTQTQVATAAPASAAPTAPVTPVPAATAPAPKPAAIVPAPAPAAAPIKSATPAADKKPANDSDDADNDDDKKPAAKPEAKPTAATPPAGTRVQLGAYKSQGEAESNWNKIARQFEDDVKGKQHYVVRADLGSKGVYYRLQMAPFASSADAEQFCLDFVSAGQGCIVTKGK
jgi:hypothetical protein